MQASDVMSHCISQQSLSHCPPCIHWKCNSLLCKFQSPPCNPCPAILPLCWKKFEQLLKTQTWILLIHNFLYLCKTSWYSLLNEKYKIKPTSDALPSTSSNAPRPSWCKQQTKNWASSLSCSQNMTIGVNVTKLVWSLVCCHMAYRQEMV